jgi:hypothetical protein
MDFVLPPRLMRDGLYDQAFAGPVEIRGNNPRFINVCFGDALIVFGKNVRIEE